MRFIFKLFCFIALYVVVQCCTIITDGLTCDEKNSILRVHNLLRSKVAMGLEEGQPPAKNIEVMTWSNKIEKASQYYANKCKFEHSPKDERGPLGENLAISRSSSDKKRNLTELVLKWYEEVENYKYGEKNEIMRVGHYTQMIWADSSELGCGATHFVVDDVYSTYLVCRYDPTGNWRGETPYVNGTPSCEEMNMKDSVVYKGLCTEMEPYDELGYEPCKKQEEGVYRTVHSAARKAHATFLTIFVGVILICMMYNA